MPAAKLTHVVVDGVGARQVGARVLAGALVVCRSRRAGVLHEVAARADVAAARKHVQQPQPVPNLINWDVKSRSEAGRSAAAHQTTTRRTCLQLMQLVGTLDCFNTPRGR